MKKTTKWTTGIGILVLSALLVYMMQPAPISVDAFTIEMQPFVITVEDQGRTRAYRPYIVAAPIGGRLLRTSLDEGDKVKKGDQIAHIALPPQDQRFVAIEQANLTAAQARLRAEQAALNEAETVLTNAQRELVRRKTLVANQLTSVEEVESFQQAVDTALARAQSGEAAVQAANAQVESVRARLLSSDATQGENSLSHIEAILAPTDGTILKVLEESERVVMPGTPLFQVSNQDNIEVVVDLLTQDAVSISPGDDVQIIGWGGDYIIAGTVRYIEPEAFTKFSALGVEEQRVNVIIDLLNAPENLGIEYRVEVAIVVWESDSELTVPTSALFQRADGWNVFIVEQEKVALRAIEIGDRNREYAQVRSGLTTGEVVIQYPSDLIREGVEVTYE
jgi:HlyD family secretion protein